MSIPPVQYKCILDRATHAHNKGNLNLAIKLYKECLAANSNDPIVLNNLGCISYIKKNFDEAKKRFLKAVELDPLYSDAYNNLGNIYKNENDLNNAKIYYQKSISLNSNYPDAYSNLGIIFQREGNIERAINHFEMAIQLNPKHIHFLNNLSCALIGRNNLKAIKILNQILSEEPSFIPAYLNLGQVLIEEKKFDKCYHLLEKALQTGYADDLQVLQTLVLQIYAAQNMCLWDDYTVKMKQASILVEKTSAQDLSPGIHPFYAQAIGFTNEPVRSDAREAPRSR